MLLRPLLGPAQVVLKVDVVGASTHLGAARGGRDIHHMSFVKI